MDDLSKTASGLGGGSTTAGGVDPAVALSGLQAAIQQEGGLDGFVTKLREGGLGAQVDSWESTGPNEPVQPEQIQQALGPDEVQRLSAGSGLDIGALLPLLAMFLPQIINMLTPSGRVPDGGLNQAAGGADLGGLLGGLLGSSGGSTGAGGLDDLIGGLGGMLGGHKN